MTNALKITESTSSISVEVLLEDAFTQESYFGAPDQYCNGGSGNSNAKYCLGNAELTSLGFTITAQ